VYSDNLELLDGRWLALADGVRDFGYIQFKVIGQRPGLMWERSGFLGRIRRAPPELLVEERHWSVDDRGVLTLNPDGWDEIDDIDLMDSRLSSESMMAGSFSARWMSDEEVDAMLENGR
jgi:hypothetical protein